MEINQETIAHIAGLARLEFKDTSVDEIMADMNRMLQFVDKLKELDTEGVEPLIFMTEETNVFRKDEVIGEITQAEALRNAPKKDMYYFRVPKVIQQP